MEEIQYKAYLLKLGAYYLITLLICIKVFYDPKPNFDTVVKALVIVGLCWLIVPIMIFGMTGDYLILKREQWLAKRR